MVPNHIYISKATIYDNIQYWYHQKRLSAFQIQDQIIMDSCLRILITGQCDGGITQQAIESLSSK